MPMKLAILSALALLFGFSAPVPDVGDPPNEIDKCCQAEYLVLPSPFQCDPTCPPVLGACGRLGQKTYELLAPATCIAVRVGVCCRQVVPRQVTEYECQTSPCPIGSACGWYAVGTATIQATVCKTGGNCVLC